MVYVGSPQYVLKLLIELLTRPPASSFDHESCPIQEDYPPGTNKKKMVIQNSKAGAQRTVKIGDKIIEGEDISQEETKRPEFAVHDFPPTTPHFKKRTQSREDEHPISCGKNAIVGTSSSFESSYTPPATFSPSSLLGGSGFDIGDEVPIDSKTHEEITSKYIQGNPPEITSRAEFLKHKIKILNVFKKWIKAYPEDFIQLGKQEKSNYKTLQSILQNFPPKTWIVAKEVRKSLEMVARVVLASTNKAILVADSKIQESALYQKRFQICKWNEENRAKYISIAHCFHSSLGISERKIAEQLTLLSIHRLSDAKSREFISGRTGSNGGQTAISSRISDWVSTEILSQTGTPKMVLMLRLWIGIAFQCFLMRNYGSTFEIIYGITRHPVSRLEFLFEAMSESTLSNLEQMKEFMSPVRNFRRYRQLLKDAVAKGVPVIPYFGVMTRDIFALENANPQLTIGYRHETFKEKEVEHVTTCMLNVKRCGDLFQIINQTLRCRHSDFKFPRSPKLMKIIETAAHEMVANQKQLSQLSENILPRRRPMKNQR